MKRKDSVLIKITFSRKSGYGKHCGMWERQMLDNFTKLQEKKLKIIPKYIDGNFMKLHSWLIDKKEFNKNTAKVREQFWKDLKSCCKINKISYEERN